MSLFKNLNIGIKLGSGFAAVVVIFALVALYQIQGISKLNHLHDTAAQTCDSMYAMNTIDSRVEHIEAFAAGLALGTADKAYFSEIKAQALQDIEMINGLPLTGAEKEHAQKFVAQYNQYLNLVEGELIPYLNMGGSDMNTLHNMFERMEGIGEKGMEHLDALLAADEQKNKQANAVFASVEGSTIRNAAVFSGVGALAAVVLAVLISFSITRPLAKTVRFALGLADGDMDQELGVQQKDEVGKVAQAMRNIRDAVKNVMNETEGSIKQVSKGELRHRCDKSGFKGEYAKMLDNINGLADELVSFLDMVPAPIMTIDKDFNIMFMNKGGAQAGGADVHGIVGKKCFDHFQTGDCNTDKCACARAMKSNGKASSETEAHPGGSDLEIFYEGIPKKDHAGNVIGAMEVVTDLTEIKQAQRRMEQVAANANKISERLASASEELSAQVEQVSQGSELQRDRVGETATAMEQMNSTVMEVAKNASDASGNSGSAKEKAASGADIVEQAVVAISEVNSLSQELKQNMGQLGAQAESIGKVMNVISDIADQTNLLALNAAIEAARAGDAGRGFAVVADEVRKLAEKTMGATKEVGDNIQAIQEAARVNIGNMDRVSEAVEKATELANESGEALKEIVGLVEVAAGQVAGIATASEEQSAASEQINTALNEVNRVVAETAEGMTQSAKAVQELNLMSGELTELIRQLNGHSKETTNV